MPTHAVTEAVNAMWSGRCERHGGAPPERCGAAVDLSDYRAGAAAIETWYLGALGLHRRVGGENGLSGWGNGAR